MATLVTAVGFTDESIAIYLASDLTWTRLADGVEEESMTVETVPLSEIDKMIEVGHITDAKTVAGLLLARDRIADVHGS